MSTAGLEDLLAESEVIVVGGPGGVGKTTVAASLGLMAALHVGGRVLVLTVDPARRLATALGLDALGNDEVQIDPGVLAATGTKPRGELWVAQLDTKEAWDQLISRHAPDAATRDAILSNTLYENVSARFVQSHDYIAMERLHDLHSSGRYDLVVVDTPPSRNAVDFLDAPQRMTEFFSSRLLRWLTVPYRSRLFTAASRPFYNIADRVLGQEFLRDVADFFVLFQTMHKGFVERAAQVERTLRRQETGFVVVSTLESAAVDESRRFLASIRARDMGVGCVVLNRVLPQYFTSEPAVTAARELGRRSTALSTSLGLDVSPDLVEGVLREVSESFERFSIAARHQMELRDEIGDTSVPVVALPFIDRDISSIDALAGISELLRT